MSKQQTTSWLVAVSLMSISAALCSTLWTNLKAQKSLEDSVPKIQAESDRHLVDIKTSENTSPIELVRVANQAPLASFSAPGTVEPNQKKVQQLTPLVVGRVRDILVSTGSKVKKGDLLVVIESPQIAELHGRLHEAEVKETLAKEQLERIMRGANKVNILKAKANLDLADSNLKRNRLLEAEGVVPLKDLLSAEAEWSRSQADYQFQNEIALNKELAQGKADLRSAKMEVEHLRDGLMALDGFFNPNNDGNEHDISKSELRAPISGTVIERFVNPGSGVDPGKALVTIADTSGIWVVANVPEKQIKQVQPGMGVKVQMNGQSFHGKVNFIDPRLNEDTRTARVRIQLDDGNVALPTGVFGQVEFTWKEIDPRASAFIPDAAIQEIDSKPVVFVKKSSAEFEARTIEIGPRCCNLVAVYKGLSPGEQIAATGAFALKSKMLRNRFEGAEG